MWQPIETAPKDGNAVARINLTLGQVAIVDIEDFENVNKISWHATERRDGKGFYAVSSSGIRMHRFLLGAKSGEIVDHVDGNGLNNTRANIRIGTQSQNCVNRKTTPGKHLRGTRPKKGKWQAYIKYKGKQRSLGYFATENLAHLAYLEEASRLHGDWMPLPPAP